MFKSLIYTISALVISFLVILPAFSSNIKLNDLNYTTTSYAAEGTAKLSALLSLKGATPTNLGIHDGKLTPCPTSPNCVISQGGDATHSIEPITYHVDRETAKKVLLQVLTVVPKTTIVETKDDYIRTESASKLLGFVDDAEFYLPQDRNIIDVRSASRLGESDLGVNRRRIEQIRLALQDLGI